MKSRATGEMNSAYCKNFPSGNFQAAKLTPLHTATPTKQKTKNYEKAYLSEKIHKIKYAKNNGIEKIINRTTRIKQ